MRERNARKAFPKKLMPIQLFCFQSANGVRLIRARRAQEKLVISKKRTRVRFLFAPAGTRLPGFCIFQGRSPASHRGAAKGRKDELGLARLPEFDWKYYGQMVKKCAFGERYRSFIKLLKTTKEIKELAMNQQKMAGLRKDILAELPE